MPETFTRRRQDHDPRDWSAPLSRRCEYGGGRGGGQRCSHRRRTGGLSARTTSRLPVPRSSRRPGHWQPTTCVTPGRAPPGWPNTRTPSPRSTGAVIGRPVPPPQSAEPTRRPIRAARLDTSPPPDPAPEGGERQVGTGTNPRARWVVDERRDRDLVGRKPGQQFGCVRAHLGVVVHQPRAVGRQVFSAACRVKGFVSLRDEALIRGSTTWRPGLPRTRSPGPGLDAPLVDQPMEFVAVQSDAVAVSTDASKRCYSFRPLAAVTAPRREAMPPSTSAARNPSMDAAGAA